MDQPKLKLPNILNLGTILPGQYGQAILSLSSKNALFLNLQLNPKSIKNGFFLLKQGSNDCVESVNIVVKPNKTTNLMIGSYSHELLETTSFHGELMVNEEKNQHKIKLHYKVEIPRIICKKMLQQISTKTKILKIIINKAVTNDARITLYNPENYAIGLQPSLLLKSSIKNTENPYILKVLPQSISADSKEQFILSLNFQTNIGFKNEFKGFKKVTLRNVLLLKTNSVLIWSLPIEITVIFVKQPQFKQQ